MRFSPAVLVFVVAAAACGIAHVAILASIVRRAARDQEALVPRPRRASEIIWAIIPAVALAFLLTATWERIGRNATPAPQEILKIAR